MSDDPKPDEPDVTATDAAATNDAPSPEIADDRATESQSSDVGEALDATSENAASQADAEPSREELLAAAAAADAEVGEEYGEEEEPEFEGTAEPLEMVADSQDDDVELQWYILKVASNREGTISDALRRRVKVEGLEHYFDQILVPTEDVAEFKNGKKRIVKRKLYPGYICVHMHINDDTWFLVRETPGIGDFTGAAGKPTPMSPEDLARILPKETGEDDDAEVKTAIPFKVEDRVRIKDGTFENFEGQIESIDEANGECTVVINIFDRATPVKIEYFHLEAL